MDISIAANAPGRKRLPGTRIAGPPPLSIG
jgi:hypothetical protein